MIHNSCSNRRPCAWLSRVVLVAISIAAAPSWSEGPTDWKPAQLPDGQPNVQGFYKPAVEGTYSLVRPARAPGIDLLEKSELRRRAGKAEPKAAESRIVDPPDGQIPYQPWARAKQREVEANIDKWVKPQHIDPQARCVPGGVTRTLFWSQLEIRQFPGYVVFVFDMNHPFRVIPLDNRPHLPGKLKLWMSDSRGHWEGNTLVVDVTNSNSKHRLDNEGDFASDQVHIVERYTFTGPDTFELQQRYEDATVYTRPWTIASHFHRTHVKEPDYEWWENECHEGEHDVEHLYQGDKSKPY